MIEPSAFPDYHDRMVGAKVRSQAGKAVRRKGGIDQRFRAVGRDTGPAIRRDQASKR